MNLNELAVEQVITSTAEVEPIARQLGDLRVTVALASSIDAWDWQSKSYLLEGIGRLEDAIASLEVVHALFTKATSGME